MKKTACIVGNPTYPPPSYIHMRPHHIVLQGQTRPWLPAGDREQRYADKKCRTWQMRERIDTFMFEPRLEETEALGLLVAVAIAVARRRGGRRCLGRGSSGRALKGKSRALDGSGRAGRDLLSGERESREADGSDTSTNGHRCDNGSSGVDLGGGQETSGAANGVRSSVVTLRVGNNGQARAEGRGRRRDTGLGGRDSRG
jgi:hypothetical protein